MKSSKINMQRLFEELFVYETPTIANYVKSRWLNLIIGRYVAWKINRKLDRYITRLKYTINHYHKNPHEH